MKRTKTGFTLVELVVVIAIVALLATILTPNVLKSIDKAKITKTVADLKTIKQAAIGIYTSLGVFPAEGASCSDRGFVTNSAVPANLQNKWEGPYLEKMAE